MHIGKVNIQFRKQTKTVTRNPGVTSTMIRLG